MQPPAGLCYCTAGANYELAGVGFSVAASEQRLWQSAMREEVSGT